MSDLEVIQHHFEKLFEAPTWKILAGFFLSIIKLMYGPVIRPAYGVVILLWLVDTGTGYYHAWANPAVVPESRRLYHGLVKLAVYYFLLFLGYQCSQIVLTAFLQGMIEGAILLTESYSVLENVEKIIALKGVNVPLLKSVMGKLKGKLEEKSNEGSN